MASVRLTWTPNPTPELVSEYVVYQTDGGAYAEVARVAETEVVLTDLLPAIYNWKIAAVNVAGESGQSEAAAGPQLPTPPTNVTVEVV